MGLGDKYTEGEEILNYMKVEQGTLLVTTYGGQIPLFCRYL